MTPRKRRIFSFRLALLLLASFPAGAGYPPAELTAVITQTRGSVEILGSGTRSSPAARLWQLVSPGARLRVGKEGFAGVVCSNRRFVRLPGPVTWPLSYPSCDAGTPLSEAQYSLVAPAAGRFRVVEDVLVVERSLRGEVRGDALSPTVVSPRFSLLRSFRPTLRWTRVPNVREYVVEWHLDDGGKGKRIARFPATEESCRREPDGLDLCTLAWPPDAWDLAPSRSYQVSVSARDPETKIWHAEPAVEATTPSLAEARRVAAELEDLTRIGLLDGALRAAEAGLLARGGFSSDAADAYRELLKPPAPPEMRVTLADLYLATELNRLAEGIFRDLLAAESPAVRAAAAFGLGRIEYERKNDREAASRFGQAQAAYAKLGLVDEEAAAANAEKKAAERAAKREKQEGKDGRRP